MNLVNAWSIADCKMSVSYVRSYGDLFVSVWIVDEERRYAKSEETSSW